MKKILLFFILLSTLIYGEVLEDIRETMMDQEFLTRVEKPLSYDEKLLETLDFSDGELQKTLTGGLTLEEHIKDLENPLYSRWAYKVADAVVILSVAEGPRRDTANYVFRKDEEGVYRYMGDFFSGDYTTGLTFTEKEGETYIINYFVDEGNKELSGCDVYDRNLKKIGVIRRSGIKYDIIEEAVILSEEEMIDMLKNQEEQRFVLGDEKYEGDSLESNVFVLDYNNDSKLDEIYLEYYQSESFNTLDELKVYFTNEVMDDYFKKALGRVIGMKLFMVGDRVYMTFLEKESFYTDRHYGNYIRIFEARGNKITEVARFGYTEEKEYEIERM